MKKKLIATLVAGAVLSTGLIGLTACGGDGHGINKGAEVSEEDWGKAFEATVAAESFTISAYMESSYTISGNYEEYGDVDMKVLQTREGTSYYDGSTYGTTNVKIVATGVPDDEELQKEYKNNEYELENYIVKEGDTYYSASYSTETEDAKWSVHVSPYDGGSATSIFTVPYSTEKNGTTAALSDLYSAFTYNDGVYTATLWSYSTEYTVSVSVKDGYIVGYSTEYSDEEVEENGNKEGESIKMVYNFSNYGSTTVSPSDDAKKAIEDYKASNN